MSIRNKVVSLVVKKLGISNKEVAAYLKCGKIEVNGKVIHENLVVNEEDSISLDGSCIREAKTYTHVLYNKPRGVESTLNKAIENNLHTKVTQYFDVKLFPVGRLDKESEGLILFTNNGVLFNRIIKSGTDLEKEYEVVVERDISDDELRQLSEGVIIMGEKTRPALVERITNNCFRIVLTQGLNRQIRRMCYKLKHEVIKLKRVRIINLHLGELQEGEYRLLTAEESSELKKCVMK